MKTLCPRVLVFGLVCAACLPAFAQSPTSVRLPESAPSDWLTFTGGTMTEDAVPLQEVDFYDEAPRFTVWGGAIFLTRSRPESQSLIRESGNTIFNANQFDFGTSAGPDINAIAHGDYFDLGLRFFQVNNISAHRTIIPGFGDRELDLNSPVDLGSDILGQLYGSSILSVELNVCRNVTERITVLAGFRFLEFEEDLRTRFDLPLDLFPAINLDVDGINRLYGAQVGADVILLSFGALQITTAGKAGIYGNTARNAARLSIDGDGNYSYGTSGSAVSFVGDLNFNGIYQITDTWAVRGGYQLLWLSGVVLASEQFPHVHHQFFPDAQVVTSGDVFLHGALVGVEASW